MGVTHDDQLAELLAIDRQLADLPDDDFANRFPLKARRADLKNELAAWAGSADDRKSLRSLQAELRQLTEQLDRVMRGRLRNNASGSGQSSLGAAIMGRWSDSNINSQIDRAGDRADLESRIDELERRIANREPNTT